MSRSRLLLPALLALALSPAAAQDAPATARSYLGVEVDVPSGFTAAKATGTTAIRLVTGEGDLAPLIVINVMKMTTVDEAGLYKLAREMFAVETITKEEEVTLESGRFLAVDVESKQGERTLTQRCLVALRNKHGYFFFLSNSDAAAFAKLEKGFGAMVAGARFFPREEDPAKPSKKADPKKADPKKADPKKADPKKADPKKADPKKADPKQPKKGQPKKPAKRTWERLSLSLASFDSEYDPDRWAAGNIVDGDAKRGWCSSPAKEPPHRFVFDLGRAREVARLVFDNACPEGGDFVGVPVKGYKVEGSLTGPKAGFQALASGELLRAKNNQAVDLTPTKTRWLRLTLESNHGHATLTELMELRAYAVANVKGSGFRLDRMRVSKLKNGATLRTGEGFRAGQRVWINFKPRGQMLSTDGKTWLEVDLILEDAKGNKILERDKVVDHVGPPPKRPLSPFVSLYVDVPEGFPVGRYVVRVLARDRFAKTSAAARASFTVKAK